MVAQRPHSDAARLADAIERAHADYVAARSTKKRLAGEFLDGVVKGFGMAVGSTIVFGLVLYLLGRFVVFPEVQEWIENFRNEAANVQQNFQSR